MLALGEAGTRCLGDSYYTRTDQTANPAFLAPYVPADSCGGETQAGRCEGTTTAVYCVEGTVHTDACESQKTCGVDADGHYRCLGLAGGCEAEGLDFAGTCTADGHARWCEDGVIRDRDCVMCEQACGWMSDAMGYYCL